MPEVSPVSAASDQRRQVKIQQITTQDEVYSLAKHFAEQGAAVAWIRNAVDDAIAAARELKSRGVETKLLHARFTIADRLEKEKTLRQTFGKDGMRQQDRKGKVVVATQVIEQSLDVDFDVMISDLAPIGSLIQRAGRLWRHKNVISATNRPMDAPVLHVLSPTPDEYSKEKWLSEVMPRGQYVYNRATQWRTAKAIFDMGILCEPEGVRSLIEAVHGVDPITVPEGLKETDMDGEGEEMAKRGRAGVILLKPEGHFDQFDELGSDDSERFMTRLGEPQTTLILAKESKDGCLVCHSGSEWVESEVSMAERSLGDGIIEQLKDLEEKSDKVQHIKREWPRSRREHTLMVIVENDGKLCDGLRYSREYGLQRIPKTDEKEAFDSHG